LNHSLTHIYNNLRTFIWSGPDSIFCLWDRYHATSGPSSSAYKLLMDKSVTCLIKIQHVAH